MKNLLLTVGGIVIGAFLQKNGYVDKAIQKAKEIGESIERKVKSVEEKLESKTTAEEEKPVDEENSTTEE